jgi:anti-sigma B factor antagonist
VDLQLTTTRAAGRAVVRVAGEIDLYSAPTLFSHIVDVLRFGPQHLVVDLEEVSFIDSSGLNVLYRILKRARASDGSMRLVCSHTRIVRLFHISGTPRDFVVHDTVEDALRAGAPSRRHGLRPQVG